MQNTFDYDDYLESQLDKHFKEQEQNEEVSCCCGVGVEVDEETNELICTECEESCCVQSLGEYEYGEYESAMEDRADAQRELERELD